MSAVDPKPTYTGSTEAVIIQVAAHLLSGTRRKEFLARFGIVRQTSVFVDLIASADAGRFLWDDWSYEAQVGRSDREELEDLFMSKVDADFKAEAHRACAALAEAMMDFTAGCEAVVLGSPAMAEMVDNVWKDAMCEPGDNAKTIPMAARLAKELTLCGISSAKMPIEACGHTIDKCMVGIVNTLRNEWIKREVAEDISYHSVSKRSRAAYSALFSNTGSRFATRYYPDGRKRDVVLRRLTGTLRQDQESCKNIQYMYCGNIRIVKWGKRAYVMDTDNIRKIYQTCHRFTMAAVHCVVESADVPQRSTIPLDVMREMSAVLIRAFAARAPFGTRLASAARAMHQLWCAEFIEAYEHEQPDGMGYNTDRKCAEIRSDAYSLCQSARQMHDVARRVPVNVRLDLLRLHHALPAADCPPELLAKLTFEIPTKAQLPNAARHAEFLAFVKSYTLCTFLMRNKKWPEVDGDLTEKDNPCYTSCIKGKFRLPSTDDLGKLRIYRHWPFIEYASQMPLRAKDATRVPDDLAAAMSRHHQYEGWEHNELLHAIKKGSNLGAPRNEGLAASRVKFWSASQPCHTILQTASKAEVTKADIKPRGTFSAPGEFRHFQAEFDRNCQVVNDLIGCGSIRADPTSHAKGIAKVAKGTAEYAFTSSHDIEGWSPSQDRRHWCDYGVLIGEMFQGLDMSAWRNQWSCFDAIVNKNGYRRVQHIYNGGFQGFPGTLDTQLHIMILTFFLHRMRASGKIPAGVVTIGKATIDDCLAQMGRFNGSMEDLEKELILHYSMLGYTIDKVKSVISRIKAIYLNQAYIKGANVAQSLKVFLKTDRPLEVVLRSAFDDIAACFSGAKAAMQVGMRPLSAYYGGMVMAVYYAMRADPNLGSFPADVLAIISFLPRGDFGLGFPSLMDIVVKEHPDARSQANHTLMMYARARKHVGSPVSDAAVRVWANAKSQPFGVVSKSSIFFNPRSCKRAGVPDVEGVRRQAVINAARGFASADPYRTILRLANDHRVSDLYAHMLATAATSIDCAFLEAYSAHLPEAILDAVVGKVTSYRVAREILGAKEIVATQRRMDAKFSDILRFHKVVPRDPAYHTADARMDLEYTSGYEMASGEREEFYAVNLVRISNHTVPPPTEVISVVGMDPESEHISHIGFDPASLRLWAPDCPRSSRSVVSRNGIHRPWKSRNWVAESIDEYSFLDNVSHTFVEGCGVVSWAEAAGQDVTAWEYVFLMRWVGTDAFGASQWVTQSMMGNIKRSSAAFGDRYHPLFCGVNHARSVDVNVTGLLNLFDADSYNIDPMSIVNTAYAIGVVNGMYYYDARESAKVAHSPFRWAVGVNPAVLEPSAAFTCEITMEIDALRLIMSEELEDVSYLQVDGGTGDQLRTLLVAQRAGKYAGVLGRGAFDDWSGEFGDEDEAIVAAPMAPMPGVLPPAAMFLLNTAPRKAVGQLITDRFDGKCQVRLLEVSPRSGRVCAMYALEEALSALPLAKRLDFILGDAAALNSSAIESAFCEAGARCVDIIAANIPTNTPLTTAAQGFRACGMVKFRWDDTGSKDRNEFGRLLGKHATKFQSEVVHAMRSISRATTGRSYAEYQSETHTVLPAANVETANRGARVSRLTKKLRDRAEWFRARIRALKDHHTQHPTDLEHHADDPRAYQRRAYLAGAMNLLASATITPEMTIDWVATTTRLRKRMADKMTSIKAAPNDWWTLERMIEWVDGSPVGIIRGVVEAYNDTFTAKWWKPNDFSQGVKVACGWVRSDLDAEQSMVYFVPRHIRVQVKVRTHYLTVDERPHALMPSQTIATPPLRAQRGAFRGGSPSVSGISTRSSTSSAKTISRASPAPPTAPTTFRDIMAAQPVSVPLDPSYVREWVEARTIGEIYALMEDNSLSWLDDVDEQSAAMMVAYGRDVPESVLSTEYVVAARASVVAHFVAYRIPLRVPDRDTFQIERDDTLIQ